jgi:hypothetical protein
MACGVGKARGVGADAEASGTWRGRGRVQWRGSAASRLGARLGAPVAPGECSCVGLALFDRIFLKIFK